MTYFAWIGIAAIVLLVLIGLAAVFGALLGKGE